MFFAILMGLTRLMAPEGEGAPAGGAPPPQPSGSPPAAPFAVFPDQASFDERVNRAARSLLHKELGTKDTTETKARHDHGINITRGQARHANRTARRCQQRHRVDR